MKQRFILLITNGEYDQRNLDKWLAWHQATFPFEIVLTKKTVNLSLKFKYFLTIPNDPITHGPRPSYGLDGIKERLRPYVEAGQYHEVIFYYPRPNTDLNLSNWTYPNDLNGASFSELTSTPEWDTQDNFYKNLRHETFHRLHRNLWFKGIPIQDTMDWYDYPANEARNFAQITPHFDKLGEPPLAKYLVYLQGVLASLQAAVANLKPSRIKDWAKAIKEWEGWGGPSSTVAGVHYPNGTLSYRNKNPGNLKFAGQAFVIGQDEQGHAIFDTEQHGWGALIRQLTIAANGTSNSFQPTMTLIEFHTKYAEKNGIGYANFVAKKLGVSPQTQIKTLLT